MIFFCHIIDVKVCFQEVDSFAILNYHLANRLNSKLIHRPILRLVFKLNTIFFYFQSLESGLNGLHLVNVREVSLGIVTCQCCGSVQAPEVDCR